STRDGWGLLPRALHWSIALLVALQIVIGVRIGLLDMYDPIDVEWYKRVIPLHKSIGLTILVLMLARVAVRRLGVTPTLPASTPRWQASAARVTHVALYALLILQPVLGYLQSAAYGATTRYFGLFVVPNVLPDAWQRPQSDALRLAAQNGHRIVAWLIAGLLIVHVLAALKHHFVDRDRVLVRMITGTARD
ncbi:MAG TPA: cytochrome b, partial [Steroidobacteraceae bacterium]|nr:cytochrome b [Steroidobacteraceae bacterium]